MSSKRLADVLDSEFQQACNVIFGTEVGTLEDFSLYLAEHMQKPHSFKSCVFGKVVFVSGEHYSPSVKFSAFDELDWKRKLQPLSINEIKDMEGISQALGERFIYTGNILLSKSRDVERSTNITDSFFLGMESEQLASLALGKDEISGDFCEMMKNAGHIAYVSVSYSENCWDIDVPFISVNAVNDYKNIITVLTKNTAFSFWPHESKNVFGGTCAFSSPFCVNTHHVQGVSRALEVDTTSNFSNRCFCHKVEGVAN